MYNYPHLQILDQHLTALLTDHKLTCPLPSLVPRLLGGKGKKEPVTHCSRMRLIKPLKTTWNLVGMYQST